MFFFFFSSRRRHTRLQGDWSSDVCSSDLSHFSSSGYWCRTMCHRRGRLQRQRASSRLTRKRSATAGGGERGKLSELFHKIKCAHRDGQPARSRSLSELAPAIG